MELFTDLDPDLAFATARLGDDAYNCRGANIAFAFQYGTSAMMFADAQSRSLPIESIKPATFDDFSAVAVESGMVICYQTDFVEGDIYLALPQWCSSEEALENVANELSCGWGIYNSKILPYS